MKTENLKYSDGEITLQGYLAYDEMRMGKRPGVLVVHEAGGLGGHPKMRARMLAKMGYIAFAVDLYGEGKCGASIEESRAMMNNLSKDPAVHRARANAGLKALTVQPNVDKKRLAAIGFCFGGMTVLELARNGAQLKGVVSFHGLLSTKVPAEPGQVNASVLVCNGAKDPLVPRSDVKAFENEMQNAGADWQVINYGDTVHSFTNPWADGSDLPYILYNKRSAARAWAAMREFFDEVLEAG